MADALGMSQRAYQSYESGKRSMPVEALVDMHRQFGVDLNWILLGVEAGCARAMIWRRWRGSRRRWTRHLGATGIRLKSEKRGAIVAR